MLACAKSCKSVQAVWYFGIDLDPLQPTPFNNTSCHTLTRPRGPELIPCQPTRPSSLITGNALALPPGASTRFSSAPKHTTKKSSGPNTQPKPPKESCTSALRWGRRAAQEPVPSAAEYNRLLAWNKPTIYIYLNTVHRNARKPTAQYTDSCKQEKAGARHSREASSLPHDLPLSPTPNRPGVCLRVRCGMVLRVTGLRLRVRRVRRAEMPSALRRSKRAWAYIYVTVVATLKSAKF